MVETVRVSKPTKDITSTNEDDFAIRADEDDVLIKEFTRGTSTQNAHTNVDITHNLGYVPFVAAWYSIPGIDANLWSWLTSFRSNFGLEITSTKITLINQSGSQAVFRYYIFYDKAI